jgi:hypothetical protein
MGEVSQRYDGLVNEEGGMKRPSVYTEGLVGEDSSANQCAANGKNCTGEREPIGGPATYSCEPIAGVAGTGLP